MGCRFAQGEAQGGGFTPASGPARPLQEIGRMRRHVVHGDPGQATNVHAHFHGGGTTHQVDFPLLESVLAAGEFGTGDLRGMLHGAEIAAMATDTVGNIRPSADFP